MGKFLLTRHANVPVKPITFTKVSLDEKRGQLILNHFALVMYHYKSKLGRDAGVETLARVKNPIGFFCPNVLQNLRRAIPTLRKRDLHRRARVRAGRDEVSRE